MTDTFKEALTKLAEQEELLQSMKKSVIESDQAFQKQFEEFLTTQVGIEKGSTFTMTELLKRICELK